MVRWRLVGLIECSVCVRVCVCACAVEVCLDGVLEGWIFGPGWSYVPVRNVCVLMCCGPVACAGTP